MYPYYPPGYFSSFQYTTPYIPNQYFSYPYVPNYMIPNYLPEPALFIQSQKPKQIQEIIQNQKVQQKIIQTTPSTGTIVKKSQPKRKVDEKQLKKISKLPVNSARVLRRLKRESNQISRKIQTRSLKYKLRERKNKDKCKIKKTQIKFLTDNKVKHRKEQIQKQSQGNQNTLQISGNSVEESQQEIQLQQCEIKPALIPQHITDLEQIRDFICKKRQGLTSRLIKI